MKIFKKICYHFFQCTWGIIENIIGFFVFLFFVCKPHDMYKNAIRTRVNFSASFSIGNFIFVSDDTDYTQRHEYGHCLQNLYWGPLSPFLFKIPSVIHWWICNIRNKWDKYYEFYPERYANILGGNINRH